MQVVRTETMRTWEAQFQQEWGLPLLLLMEQAAQQLAEVVEKAAKQRPDWPIVIFCGWGNNGGDGYALARHLRAKAPHRLIQIYEYAPTHSRSEQAQLQRQACLASGIHCLPVDAFAGGKVVGVDAVFGTGLKRRKITGIPAEWEELQAAWQKLNPASIWFAVDLPSGLCGDTGVEVMPCRQPAARCLALGAAKPVHFLPTSHRWVESVTLLPLTLPELSSRTKQDDEAAGASEHMRLEVWEPELACRTIPRIKVQVHKGQRGNAVILGGAENQAGAGILALQAAFAAGAGRVYAWLPQPALAPALQLCPHALISECPLLPQSEWHSGTLAYLRPFAGEGEPRSAILLGPGLSLDARGHEMLRAALRSKVRLILDASAIRLLAESPQAYRPLLRERARVEGGRYRCLLTPHVGEYRALLEASPESLRQEDLFEELVALAEHWQVSLLYKSHISYFVRLDTRAETEAEQKKPGTIPKSTLPRWKVDIFPYGGPALARAGSGDILAGTILGRLVQTGDWEQSVPWSVYLCGAAAEERARTCGIEGWSVDEQLCGMQKIWHHWMEAGS